MMFRIYKILIIALWKIMTQYEYYRFLLLLVKISKSFRSFFFSSVADFNKSLDKIMWKNNKLIRLIDI